VKSYPQATDGRRAKNSGSTGVLIGSVASLLMTDDLHLKVFVCYRLLKLKASHDFRNG